jgi:hypothetical protein
MTKENDERYDRAIMALEAAIAQGCPMRPGYDIACVGFCFF